MKLGTRFLLLTLSLIAVPILIGSALGLVQWLTEGWTTTLGSYTAARRWLDRAVQDAQTTQEIITSRPRGVELVIADADGLVIAATEGMANRGELTLEELAATPTSADPREVLVVPLPNVEGAAFLIAQFGRPPAFSSRPPWVPAVVGPFVLLAPVIVISLWILRDLRRSILTLRDAAVRISSGDLEFHLDTTGNDEFAEVRRSFETMRHTIREEYDRRARFTLGVSHDLKTPLALIKGYTEAIEDGHAADAEKLARYVRIIRERSDLLQERIVHLISFLKLSTGEWLSTLKPVALGPFLTECIDAASTDAALEGRTISSSITLPEDLVVRLDPVLVRRALENLIHNAISHSAPEAWVRVEAQVEARATAPSTARADTVRITVANGGQALPASDLPLLSEPFYRGDTARSGAGVGLGLSIVRSVVESHGWSLRIDDNAAGETRFVIELPRHAAQWTRAGG